MASGLYYVDAQGDVTWRGANGRPLPALSISKESDLRFRNYRFPNVAWVPTEGKVKPGKPAVVPVTLEVRAHEDWLSALEDLAATGSQNPGK